MGVTAGIALGEIADAGELSVRKNAVRDAQPAHVGFLRRRTVEQAEEAPAEIVVGLRRLVLGGLVLQLLVAVERMQLALEFFRVRQLAAGLDGAILGAQRRGIGADRFRRSSVRLSCDRAVAGRGPRCLRDLQTGHKAFEIAFLLRLEISRHSALPLVHDLHSSNESSGSHYSAGTPVGVGAKTLPAACGL